MDLWRFPSALRARWRFIAMTVAIGTLMAVALTLATPPTYASTTTLWITTQPTGVSATYQVTATAGERAQTYANLATEPATLQRVAERLDSGLTVSDLGRQVSATVSPDTLLLQVEAKASSPELAQQIASMISEEVMRQVQSIEAPSDSSVPAPVYARVAAEASLPRSAVSPDIPQNLMIGIGLSLLAGMAGAVWRGILDTSVRGADDVEAVTGSVPMAALPFDPDLSEHLLSSENSGGPLSEAFGVLNTNIRFADLDTARQAIVVTSSLPDEGKTFVATNLATSIARSGRSVLLLDADLRNSGLADQLGLESSVGLVTVLLGHATLEQAMQQHDSGVTFLGTGPQPPDPAALLGTQAMRDLLTEVRESFDVVVVDAPPLLPVADAAILATEVDGALLLVRHGTTNRGQLRGAVDRIQTAGGEILGTVENQVPMSGSSYGYGYGYGYGYPIHDGRKSTGSEKPSASQGRRVRRFRMRGNLRPWPVSNGRAAGLATQAFFAIAVPLMVLPVALASQPVAFVCAAVLALAALAPLVGLMPIGSGFLFVGFATVPFNDLHPIGALGWMEPSDPFFVAGFLLLIPRFLSTPLRLPTTFLVGAIGLVTIGVLSARFADQPGLNFAHLLDVVQGVVLLPVLLVWWQPGTRAIIAAASAYMLGNGVNVVASVLEGPVSQDRYDGFSTHPNVFGYCLVLSLALVPFLLKALPRRYHWIIGILALIFMYGIWISGSRATLVCAVALTLLYPLYMRSIQAALAVGALFLAALVVVNRMAQSADPSSTLGRLLGSDSARDSDDARVAGARAGMEQFLDEPLLGGGWLTVWGAHDVYLQIAAAIGVFGLVFYLVLLTPFLRPLIAVRLPYGLLAAPALAVVLLDVVLPVLGARYVWCVLGLTLSASRLAAREEAADSVPDPPPDRARARHRTVARRLVPNGSPRLDA